MFSCTTYLRNSFVLTIITLLYFFGLLWFMCLFTLDSAILSLTGYQICLYIYFILMLLNPDQDALENEAKIVPLINEKKRLFNELLTTKGTRHNFLLYPYLSLKTQTDSCRDQNKNCSSYCHFLNRDFKLIPSSRKVVLIF